MSAFPLRTAFALSLILIAGCAMTRPAGKLTAFKDPAYTSTSYRRILVHVDTVSLQWRHDLETQIVKELRQRDVDAVESYKIEPPTRQWPEDTRAARLAENGFDAYLRLAVDAVEVQERVVPVTTTRTVEREKTEKKKPATDTSASSERETKQEVVTTKTEGGHIERRSRVRYSIKLIDVRSGATAWIALNDINGDPAARMKSFSAEIADQLLHDSVALLSDGVDPW